jgi:peptidoglycan/xylan/chitin deacetylase (PgdA/CDA1 family)
VLIPNKREFIARRLRDAGLLRLLEHAARRPVLVVLTYHRIGDPGASPFYDRVYSATPEALRAQLLYLRDHFHMPPTDAIDADGPVRVPTALVTFDDGYRDNAELALPVLAELGVPGAFFLPAALIDEPRVPWWDHAAYVVKASPRPRITLDEPTPLTLDLARDGRAGAVWQVVRLYLDGRIADEPRFRAHLEQRADVAVDDAALRRALFVGWADVARLTGAGMTIGAHGHTHRALGRLSEQEQRAELVNAQHLLAARTGRRVDTLAYPFGWPGTFTETTQRLAREVGFRLAFSALEGVNPARGWNPLALRRLNIGSGDSPILVRARTALQRAFGRSFL